MSIPSSRHLHFGVSAPQFDLKDIYDRRINLQNYIDKKILIGFFRHAGCPFCNLRVHTLTKIYEELKAQGMEMIFFFESKESVLLRSIFHKDVSPIPIISDPEKIWYNAYGIEQSGMKSAVSHITSFVQTAWKARQAGVPIHAMADGESIKTMPAEFLIDKGLIVKKVHYSNRLTDRMDISMIYDFVNN
jgi:thioredoxin-dependent peroxiredoxin